MKVQKTNFNGAILRSSDYSAKNVSFSAAAYAPRAYKDIRNLADAVYENSSGAQRLLMNLYKLRGENLNNMITAVGTAGVAPFFIRYNPFSREDADSKAYSAWRQPISAGITLGGQLLVMNNYNKMLDRHAAYAGVDTMDLRAKPPASVLKPTAKLEYEVYKANCILNGQEFLPKKKWIANRILELQDKAYYNRLNELRRTMDISKVPMKDIVKPSDINSKTNSMFRDILINDFKFNEAEVSEFKNFNDFLKRGKQIAKLKHLDMNNIQDYVISQAEDAAIKDLEKVIDFEARVKHETSTIFKAMKEELAGKKVEIMAKHTANGADMQSKAILEQIEKEVEIASQEIYQKHLKQLADKCLAFAGKSDAEKTTAEKVLEFAYKKVSKQGNMKNIKFHGETLEEAIRSVKIKKWLNNLINNSEVKLKTFKDRSGVVVGLLILPITCTILNWAYPKIMKKLFPRLSEVKEAKKNELKEARLAELANQNEAKEVK